MDEEEYVFMHYDPSLSELYENCITPTLNQSLEYASQLLTYNAVFTAISNNFCHSEKKYHMISTLAGLGYIYLCTFPLNAEAFHVLPLVYIAYILLHLFKKLNLNVGHCIGTLMILVVITYEFTYYNHESWLQIKSVVMIAMMKIMSIAFDLKDPKSKNKIPSIWAYSGYIWCPANSVLGPWTPYKEYLQRYTKKPKLSLQWLLGIFRYIMMAAVFVTTSNCFSSYLMPDSYNRYVLSFRNALTFRTSHYFISYLSSAAMITAGFRDKNERNWSYKVTSPFEIEAPRSLVSVVINWNIPTHTFLKKYIFAGFLPYGNFAAVLMTYLVSSMLHGLNIAISVVLLSLGLFSYVQYKFQDSLANFLNCCIRVRPCRNGCNHSNKYGMKRIFNLLFMGMSIMYLAYTGCLITNINVTESTKEVFEMILDKWQSLNFYGHYLALFSVFITFALT